jgi:hypothetical protein
MKHEHKDTKYRCVNNSQIQVTSRVFAIITHYEVMYRTHPQSSSTLWNYSKCGVYTVESEAGC